MLQTAQFVTYFFPVVFVTGILANTAVVMLMLTRTLRRRTTSLFLVVLALTDNLILVRAFITQWAHFALDIDIDLASVGLCQVLAYLRLVLVSFEAALLVMITLERLTAVIKPHKVKIWFSKKRAAVGVLMIFIICALYHIYVFWYLTLHETPAGRRICAQKAGLDAAIMAKKIVDAIPSKVGPWTVIVISNVKMVSQMKRRPVQSGSIAERRKQADRRSLTRTLLLTTSAYILLTAPRLVVGLADVGNKVNPLLASDDHWWWAYIISEMLFYLNSAIHIVFYTVVGKGYRREFKRIFNCKGDNSARPQPDIPQAQQNMDTAM